MISRLAILTTLLCNIHHSICTDDGYLQFVKDSCIVKGEALNCVKYRALKIAKTTIFGDNIYNNETIKASEMFSFVPLEEELVKNISTVEDTEINQRRSFLSEWAELAKYMLRLVKEFFRVKGLKMELPDGARTLEEEVRDHNGRGKKKKLALIVPLLTLLAAAKAKLLLIPILLAVLFIKKLLIAAAFLVPSLLNTLKACKHHHHSYFGNSEASDFSSDYGYSNSYASGAGYAKDWASNRAYNLAKHRATQAPVYITAPGAAV